MKLYVMRNGTAPDMPKEARVSTGAPIDPTDVVAIPTMTCLIDHPAGYVLYDTGWSDPSRWPMKFKVPEDEKILNSLARVGVKAEDIKYLICSHLHLDHSGSLELFPNAQIIVSDVEFTNVAKLYLLNKLGTIYIKADVDQWVKQGLNWKLIDSEYEVVDFLDGIKLITLGSGHSFGMLALLVELPKTGNVILTSDAIYCTENVGPPIQLPGVIQDPEGYKKSLHFLLDLAKKYNAQLWYGHDMEQFNSLITSDKGYYE